MSISYVEKQETNVSKHTCDSSQNRVCVCVCVCGERKNEKKNEKKKK